MDKEISGVEIKKKANSLVALRRLPEALLEEREVTVAAANMRVTRRFLPSLSSVTSSMTSSTTSDRSVSSGVSRVSGVSSRHKPSSHLSSTSSWWRSRRRSIDEKLAASAFW